MDDEVRRTSPAAAEDAGEVHEWALSAASDELLSDEAKQRLADTRDTDANKRDLAAEVRDHDAGVRDRNAQVRDERQAELADSVGPRERAARDRKAAARDRAASDSDRQLARADREVSRWDRAVARTVEADLRQALAETDNVAETTLLIGQAQGVIIADQGGDAVDALIELRARAAADDVALLDAARETVSGASSDQRVN